MKLSFLPLAVIASALTMQANVVIPPGTNYWQQVAQTGVSGEKMAGTLNNDGGTAAFWNNNTDDGNTCRNIGCFVTKTGGFSTNATSPDWSDPVYLGEDDGSSVQNFYFQGQNGGTQLLLEVAGWAPNNWMGWYAINPAAPNGAIHFTGAGFGTQFGLFFDGNDLVGSTVATIPATNYGLWFLSNYSSTNFTGTNTQVNNLANALNNNSGRRFSQSSRNSSAAGTSNQYFAVFAESLSAATSVPVTYIIGVEDKNFGNGSDKDYNDMIVKLTVVPEPGFYTLLSVGFVGLMVARRRKK